MKKQKFYWEFVDGLDGDEKTYGPWGSVEECIAAAQDEALRNLDDCDILVGTSITDKLSNEDLDNCDYTDSVIETLTEILGDDIGLDIDIPGDTAEKAESAMEDFLTKWIKQYLRTERRLVRDKATVHRLPRVEPEKPDTTDMETWLAQCPDATPETRKKITAVIQGGKTAKRK
jgi:hypothetical protein